MEANGRTPTDISTENAIGAAGAGNFRSGAMNESASMFAILRNFVEPPVADAIERVVRDGTDRELCRINALAFAGRHGLNEEHTIAGFLHAASIGLFDISWNVLCPGCGGVLDTNASLKT